MIAPRELPPPVVHRQPAALLVFTAVLLLNVVAGGQMGLTKALVSPSPTPTSSPQPSPAPGPATSDQPIPLPEVADRAEQVDRQLRDIANELIPSDELVRADEAIKTQLEEINQRARQAEDLLPSMPSPIELQEEERYWRTLTQDYSSFRKLLASRASSLGEKVLVLENHKAQWRATLAQIHNVKGIEPVLDRVGLTLKVIDDTRTQTEAELTRIVNLQTQVAQQDQIISQMIARVDDTRKRMRGRILQRDSAPLWRAREEQGVDQSISSVASRTMGRGVLGVQEFLRTKRLRFILSILLYGLALWITFHFKHRLASHPDPEVASEAAAVFAHPYAVALLVALLATIGQMLSAPPGILVLIYVLYCVLLLRLSPPLIHSRAVPLLLALGAACFAQGVYLLIQVSPLTRREIFIAVMFAALTGFGWLTRPSAIRSWEATEASISRGLLAVRIAMGLLAGSIVANVMGFVSLSHTVGTATLLGAYAAVLLYIAVRVTGLMLVTGFRLWGGSLGQKRRENIENWGRRTLSIVAVLLWIDTVLYLFSLRDSVKNIANRLLSHPIGLEKVHVTPGDVLGFLLVLFGGYLAARLLTFALRELLLSRMRLQHGLPHAISTITYYILLVLVFLAALVDAGVELNKFTVITGALGIGVGFGLQNVVNNFVSGLLLLFERPIRVGDTIEIGTVIGTVQRIGVRSCTIQTFQDAEVIVPNSNLTSNQVTNWTLSSPWRRVEISVAVAYGTDPERLIALLTAVAESHQGVRRYPRPAAFFIGFGDSAMNFELRFWAAQEVWFDLKSEVTVHICRALQEAGINIPFPQRDLHVRAIDEPSRKTFSLDHAEGRAQGEKISNKLAASKGR